MKKCNLLYSVLAVFVLSAMSLFIHPLTAHADPAHCFIREIDQSAAFHSVDCSDAIITAGFAFSNIQPPQPQENQCYAATGTSTAITVEKQDITSDICKQWLIDAGETQSHPPVCTVIDGSIADWNQGKIKDLNKLHAGVSCNDYISKLQTSGQVADFQPGNCYLIFNDNGKYITSSGTCGLALTELVSRQQLATNNGQVVGNADRENAIHCGEKPGETPAYCLQNNPLVKTVSRIVSFISAGIGVIVVIMVIVGGIQYITAGNNPQAVSAAKKRISNALIALVAFLLLFAFMNWLLPGGLL